MTVNVTLTNEPSDKGKTRQSLSSTGCSRSMTSHTGNSYDDFEKKHATNFIGGDIFQTVPENKEAVLYVEGDSPFKAQPKMSPVEFGKQNNGNFILVTLKWSNAP